MKGMNLLLKLRLKYKKKGRLSFKVTNGYKETSYSNIQEYLCNKEHMTGTGMAGSKFNITTFSRQLIK